MNIERIKALQAKIEGHHIDALLINNLDNIRYLCGFNGSAGWLVVGGKETYLAVDSRYSQQARNDTRNTEISIIDIKGDLESWLPQLIFDRQLKAIGFEADNLVYSTYRRLADMFKNENAKIEFTPCQQMVESLRAIKDEEELAYITQACGLADAAFEFALSRIQPGVTESWVAWEMEKYLKESGSENIPFEIIVASGDNASMPHAKTTHKALALHEPVLLDFGARVAGYCSDFSRTVFLGKIDDTFKKVYDIVLASQLTALSTITVGITGEMADSYSRRVIDEAGYGDNFGHSLGHGIGLAVHEYPRLGPKSADILQDGMTFTVEPGIYIQGWGGVRIEDSVILKDGKAVSLTRADKLLRL